MPETLTSKENRHIKQYKLLQSDRKTRRETELLVTEGVRLCMEALSSGLEILQVFITEGCLAKSPECEGLLAKAGEAFVISEGLSNGLSDTKSPQGVFCICRQPVPQNPVYDQPVLLLENINDPGNMGTILRTAEALGITLAVCSADCCDIYSPKVLRGSMGSAFRLNISITPDMPRTISELSGSGYQTLAAVPDRDAQSIADIAKAPKTAIAIGNEANGLTDETIAACTNRVTIPMAGRAESLNAAMAAGILMWELLR